MNACAACDCADPTALPGLAAECECGCHRPQAAPKVAPTGPTRAAFLDAYRNAILAEYGPGTSYPWAADAGKLERFMGTVRQALEARRPFWDFNAPCVRKAWKTIGCTGRPTFRALCDLP